MEDVLARIRDNEGAVLNDCELFENTIDESIKWQIIDRSEEFDSLDDDSLVGFANLIRQSMSEEIEPFFSSTGTNERGIAFRFRTCSGCLGPGMPGNVKCGHAGKADMFVDLFLIDAVRERLERNRHRAESFDSYSIINLLLALRGGADAAFESEDERGKLVASLEKSMKKSLKLCNSEDIIVFSQRIAPFVRLNDGIPGPFPRSKGASAERLLRS